MQVTATSHNPIMQRETPLAAVPEPSGQQGPASGKTAFAPVSEPAKASKASDEPARRQDDQQAKRSSEPSAQSQIEPGKQKTEQRQEQQIIQQLKARDREVRLHEQAHASVGGHLAGPAQYEYKRGPDGGRYAVSGEVSIDTSKAEDPQATLRKAEKIRAAALAPAEPSAQDRRVAAEATQMSAEARVELQQQEDRAKQASDAQKQKQSTESSEQSSKTEETDQPEPQFIGSSEKPNDSKAEQSDKEDGNKTQGNNASEADNAAERFAEIYQQNARQQSFNRLIDMGLISAEEPLPEVLTAVV